MPLRMPNNSVNPFQVPSRQSSAPINRRSHTASINTEKPPARPFGNEIIGIMSSETNTIYHKSANIFETTRRNGKSMQKIMATRPEITSDEFTIMPDHMHGILTIADADGDPVGARRPPLRTQGGSNKKNRLASRGQAPRPCDSRIECGNRINRDHDPPCSYEHRTIRSTRSGIHPPQPPRIQIRRHASHQSNSRHHRHARLATGILGSCHPKRTRIIPNPGIHPK